MTVVRMLLVGLGNLGRRFCEIVAEREDLLAERYGLRLVLVGAVDSRGLPTTQRGSISGPWLDSSLMVEPLVTILVGSPRLGSRRARRGV